MGDLSEDAPDDIEGLDAAAAHVANLLSTEPADSMFLSLDAFYLERLYWFEIFMAIYS